MLYHRKIKNNTTRNKLAYDDVKKLYEKLIIQKKKIYYQNMIHEYNSDMRKTWGLINTLLGKNKRKEPIKSLNINGVLCDDSQTIANEFNKLFSNIPKNLHKKTPKNERKK